MLKITTPDAPRTKPATSVGIIKGRVRTWNKSTPFKKELQDWIHQALTPEDKEKITKDPSKEIHLTIKYFMPIPASSSKVEHHLMEWGLTPHISKPDVDNLSKFSFDVGSQFLWPDDRQLVCVNMRKEYSSNPRVEYAIEVKEARMDEKTKTVLGQISIHSAINLCYLGRQLYQKVLILEDIENMPDELKQSELAEVSDILASIAVRHGTALKDIAKKLEKLEIDKKTDYA